ncbi:EAL domain-containing protein [Duganella ginsengisoli]|uniref:EAL domain-containing protein n=2 Tax=Pseudoduganella ginsengisoli TaxID=1462440 RepID=A0A6L6Q2B1_9BURK|nr:EAL domain-containing protein [Pseudoduganella ginsengisoli]
MHVLPALLARLRRMALETYVSLPLFTVLLLGAIWTTTLHFNDSELEAARNAAGDSLLELSDTYEAQVVRNLQGIEQTLKVLKYAVEKKGAAGALPELQQNDLLPPGLVFVVSIADASGRIIASNPPAEPISIAREDYFQYHRQRRTNSTYIAQAMRDLANKDWHLHFTRRLNTPEGEFAGVVVVEVDPGYFTSGYERARLGEQGVLGLVGSDGVTRVLRVGEQSSWGQKIEPLPAKPAGIEAQPSSWDGVRRYASLRPLPRYQLSVLVGLSEQEQLAPAYGKRRERLVEAGAASLGVLLVAALAWFWIWQGARARRHIRRAQETYAAASEANMDAFFVLRAMHDEQGAITDFKITTANSRAEQMSGHSKQTLQGQTLCDWLPQARHNGIFKGLVRIAREGGVLQEEWENTMPQLNAGWIHAQVVGVEGGAVMIVRDITERKEAEHRIFHMALHDSLTGLPNRSLIGDRLQQAIAEAQREHCAVHVAFIDLDGFKLVNDGLGHTAGDLLLKEVAGRMSACLRRHDTVGRFGGDEFVLVLPQQKNDISLTASLLERVREAVIGPVLLDEQEVRVSCSIGVAMYPRDGDNPDTLLMNADAAMYRAKETGKNNVQFYTQEMNSSLEEKLALLDGLRKALAENQLLVEYQPKADLASGLIFGVEALVRWRHPERGLIRPDIFIPLAEECGMIGAIGDWVLQQACQQARAWQMAGLPPMTMSVNVSPRQFDDLRLVARVADALHGSGLAAGLLELEVTESLIMRDVGQAVAKMRELEAMGVALSIDDFGTGYSSLSSLKRFPISRLKIDKSFVRDLDSSADDRAIARAIISLAHELDVRVIAEGVETEQQRAFLQTNGCDEMQGYLLSRPVAPQQIEALLVQQMAAAEQGRFQPAH